MAEYQVSFAAEQDIFDIVVYTAECEHHYIFGQQPVDDEAFMIVAVLHERMDIISRLAGRLGG